MIARWELLVSIVIASSLGSCTSERAQRVVRVWHFWSEPAQERAFRSLVDSFERKHPNVRIELVPLLWSDGKAKLQIALASNAPPDVVHIGAEWVADFAPALLPIKRAQFDPFLDSAFASLGVCDDGIRYAIPWTVNARVLFVHTALGIDSTVSWGEFLARIRAFHSPPNRYGIGFCVSDPHNVLKRVLPWVWAAGGHLFATVPWSAAADSTLVAALAQIEMLLPASINEQSRQLDARVRRGQLGAVLSGVWLLADSAVCSQYRVLPTIPHLPGTTGASILSGDCYAIARGASNREDALAFLKHLATWNQAEVFCTTVPDAGFPAFRPPSERARDRLLDRASHWRAAYAQTRNSVLLPRAISFLEAERIVEEQLTLFLYRQQSSDETVAAMKTKLSALGKVRADSNPVVPTVPYQSERVAVVR